MSNEYKNIDKLIEDVNEDEIIKELISQYPDLWDDLDYNEYTIANKIQHNPFMTEQWRLLLIKEKHKLHRIEILKDEYQGNLYHQLRFENDIKLGKQEVERYYLPKDEKLIKFFKLELKQQIRVEFYDSVYESFRNQGWLMKQFLIAIDR